MSLKIGRSKTLSVIMTIAMVFSVFAGMTVVSSADEAVAYTGQEQPGNYIISTASQLEMLAEKVNDTADPVSYQGSTFTLTADIDMSDSDWTGIASGATVTSHSVTSSPTVTAGTGFAGTFNGGGKTVTIELTPSKGASGLFGYLAPAGTVTNLTVAGSVSTSGSYDAIGGAVGYNAGTIDNVINTANVNAPNCYNVGGIAGFNDAYYTSGAVGVIKNCQNSGTITGKAKTGGIAGENAGLITSCSNTGNVTSTGGGKDGTGGIAGRNGNNNTAVETGTIRNCYNTGEIKDFEDVADPSSGGRWIGGITGFQNSLSKTINCYSTGPISGYRDYNNIVGENEGTTTNCYGSRLDGSSMDDEGNSTDISETGTIKTVAEMKTTEFADQLSFEADGLWDQDPIKDDAGNIVDYTLPYLTYLATETSADSESTPVAGTVYLDGTATGTGNGTAENPYSSYETAVAAAGSGGTIYVKGTVTFSSTVTRNDSVTVKRASGFSGALIKIDTGSADTYVSLTSMTVDGNGNGTLFDVDSGRLRLRGNIKLQNAAIGVDVAAGAAVEVNKTTINTTTAVNLDSATSQCILNDFGGTEINGTIYLKTGATVSVASALNDDITIATESEAETITVAKGTDNYALTESDADKLNPVANLGYVSQLVQGATASENTVAFIYQ